VSVKKKLGEKWLYKLKITLLGIRPPIWRRILVPQDIALHQLHVILQIVMGWTISHLHKFIIEGAVYRQPSIDGFQDDTSKNETKFDLQTVAPGENGKFIYVYDFGDYWQHEILIEKILPLEKGIQYPVCVTGKRACPPEDCGGPSGYRDLLEILSDTSHPEHDDKFNWLPGDFDSEKFDPEPVNKRLKQASKKGGRI
jgi:hypothetical protein